MANRRVRELLKGVKEGELVVVKWWDACTWRDVPNTVKNPEVIDSPIYSIGAFGGFVRGERIEYLRLVVERKPETSDITYIPVQLIESVERERFSVPKKGVRNYLDNVRYYGEGL
ncbi:MAG: hypothetical protein NZ733_03745 [Aigarchaeota archaeon]|nr:hypothetical protein [Aigarchaeota archaeon]MCS7127351.1 hypothetical protein [Candidatus Calditenuaceae archaeon]MDW8042859.1 hypothetical protein [Nitrososphaerota archaeon]